MVDIKTLLPKLKNLVTALGEDLLARATSDAQIDAGLRDAFQQIEEGGRTARAFEVWREDYLDQVAVAWVLACVFVRFMEDNQLIDECWLAGEGERRKLAEDTHELFFRSAPHDTDREYFQHVFHEIGKIPAAKDLFAEGKTPLWAVAPSGDAAMSLLKFWREMDAESGHLQRSFAVENGDTRFLGDLYQELSERAKKKFALLQTPVFVEEFILDRTLTPALAEFGLEKVRMIDPTCGSGHFLLGGFARLFREWCKRESNEIVAAQKAMDGVWGVDINPFAVAIARFRLVVAAVHACGIERLKEAPAWKIHLATGDSLLFGSRWERDGRKRAEARFLDDSWAPDIYACEDKDTVRELLGQQYHAVVGNPPYITVKDSSLNAAYRRRYTTCHRKYSLAAPFAERFFDLAITGPNGRAGYIGMITANSFMKRQFGKKLIEAFFPIVDLTHVIDTTGAYIPGHTTSTVILFGRNRPPSTDVVRAVLGIRGEAGVPADPPNAPVWKSISSSVDAVGTEDAYMSVCDLPRMLLRKHPWSIGGGGTGDLKLLLEERAEAFLQDGLSVIGVFGMTNADDVFIAPEACFLRSRVSRDAIRRLYVGNEIRNWACLEGNHVIFPYNIESKKLLSMVSGETLKWLWPARTVLGNRVTFDKESYFQAGLAWWKWHQVALDRLTPPMSILFAEIATHNHFVLDHNGCALNQTAHMIKLPPDAHEDAYYALLSVLNSSTMCFWAKQVMPCKGLGGQGGGIKPEPWSRQYVFSGTMVKKCPLPRGYSSLSVIGKAIDENCTKAVSLLPGSVIKGGTRELESGLRNARAEYESINRRIVALQEELDWKVYTLFELCEETTASIEALDGGLHPEDRPVERLLKERMNAGEHSIFYNVHLYRGTGEPTNRGAASWERTIEERLRIIKSNPDVRLIEHQDFKRRWQCEPWEKQEQAALRCWMLDRLESDRYWASSGNDEPTLQSTAQLTDKASSDQEFLQVAALYRGRADFDLGALVAELVNSEAVPLLPVLRYRPSGLRKREVWERTWELQRQQDAGQDIQTDTCPPSYGSADFQRGDFWRLRGALDVPKERWISYPHCSTESDPTLVVGWAGWNHLEQATALIAYYDARKREGWDAKRLTPLLAGLDQLLPWIHQWHPEIDPAFGETAGQSFQTMLGQDAHELGLTLEEIRAWEPPQKAGRQTRKARTKKG